MNIKAEVALTPAFFVGVMWAEALDQNKALRFHRSFPGLPC